MSPIIASLGGLSANSYGLFGNAIFNSFESIQTVTVGSGGQVSVTFSSIPSTYKHLQIRCLARSTYATTQDNAYFIFNSDTSSSYAFHYLYGTGATAAAGGLATQTKNLLDGEPGSSIAANIFGATVLDILNYSNTNKYKTSRMLTGWDGNGSGNIALQSGLWQSTSTVNAITITNTSSFAQYSSFALYGIKG